MANTVAGIDILPTLEAKKLIDGCHEERARLLDACVNHGFFYLDLSKGSTSYMIQAWEDVLTFMDRYFDQSIENKMSDAKKSDIIGYEPCGTSTGAADGRLDHYESLKVQCESSKHAPAHQLTEDKHQVSLMQLESQSHDIAPAIKEKMELFQTFVGGAHGLTMTILEGLAEAMHLPAGKNILLTAHEKSKPNTSTMSMFRYPHQSAAEVAEGLGHNKHTDLGTLTFLLCRQPGLQVLSPQLNKWVYVEPKPGHAIINVGDSLRYLSQNKLLSAVHRVLPHGGRQVNHRHSIAFFLRPADDTVYSDVCGRSISARAWHDEKFDHFRASHLEQAQNVILTGGMERAESHMWAKGTTT